MLGLVADDLTGAGDASVQFAKRGWDVFLVLDDQYIVPGGTRTSDDFSRTTVIAVTTDARALDNVVAENRTAAAVAALMKAGADRLFLKIDSTMRGSVPGQVSGALASWRTRYLDARVVVCPAYPAMGRTVEANRLLVHGEPVDVTAFGRDPVTPVTTSDMAKLLPASPRIEVIDAATDADLIAIAESISATGSPAIAAGSGGLAGALSEIWSATVRMPDHVPIPRRKNPRILLQVSSLNPVSRTQAARLEVVFTGVVVLLTPQEPGDSAKIAESLARDFVAKVEREQWDVLGLIGGDGARETLAQLGASGIRVVGSLLEGVPLGIVVGGKADGTPVFTKAGGFGGEDALVRCVERMSHER